MSPKAIAAVWKGTIDVFKKYKVSNSEKALESIIEPDLLDTLLKELNSIAGSSLATCIEGG